MIDIAVIGGGVSGLTTAWALMRRGHNVVVLERQVQVGGNAVSERINGFLMEHGPSTINATVPQAGELSRALGLDDQIVPLSDNVRSRYLARGGDLSGIPVHPLGFLMSNYLSLSARLRLLGEAFVPRGNITSDETVSDYFSRRFGAEFADRIMDPLVGGLYAGRADCLSLQSVFPKLSELEQEHGSIMRAVLKSRLNGGKMPGKRLFSWENGVATLPQALSRVLAGRIRTGVTVSKVRQTAGGMKIETLRHGTVQARAVVMATQPHVAAPLLEAMLPDAAEQIAGIEAPPVAVVFLGYKRDAVEHPLDGVGYLSPSTEGNALTGTQFSSTMFAGRAPEGYVSLTAYLGGARNPDVHKAGGKGLIAMAEDEFCRLLGTRGQPALSRVRVWSRGIPQYNIGHRDRVARIQAATSDAAGMFVTGNYLSGPSMGACVANAMEVSGQTSAWLNKQTDPKEVPLPDRHVVSR